MGASGADLLLSPAARRLFPYYVECKNVESLNIWKALAQAQAGAVDSLNRGRKPGSPIVVFSRNGVEPQVALSFHNFINLLQRANANSPQ